MVLIYESGTEVSMWRWIQGVSLSEHDINEETSSADSNIPDAEAITLVWTCQA